MLSNLSGPDSHVGADCGKLLKDKQSAAFLYKVYLLLFVLKIDIRENDASCV